ncbi:hypothetical protein KAR91_81855, partial [Candidatus Pacearchaeota archaeon]|nr:hypothetical protein [Candidatus Pacearchaeota archaeon]
MPGPDMTDKELIKDAYKKTAFYLNECAHFYHYLWLLVHYDNMSVSDYFHLDDTDMTPDYYKSKRFDEEFTAEAKKHLSRVISEGIKPFFEKNPENDFSAMFLMHAFTAGREETELKNNRTTKNQFYLFAIECKCLSILYDDFYNTVPFICDKIGQSDTNYHYGLNSLKEEVLNSGNLLYGFLVANDQVNITEKKYFNLSHYQSKGGDARSEMYEFYREACRKKRKKLKK